MCIKPSAVLLSASPIHTANMIIKFADDTTVIGLISAGYRSEIKIRAAWSSKNNLSSVFLKTNELLMEFGRNATAYVPLIIGVDYVERVDKIRFLRI